MIQTKISFFILSFGMFVFGFTLQGIGQPTKKTINYRGKPYTDSLYKTGAQTIPGKLQCEFYDLGGEGIAFHDTDSKNEGSGGLNPADGTYLNEFRKNEGVQRKE